MNKVLDRLQQQGFLVLDGALGTQLFARGLVSGGSPEAWNVEHPERVQSVHQAYVDAGSDVILTNSFGGTRYRLKLHEMQDRVVELNRAAAGMPAPPPMPPIVRCWSPAPWGRPASCWSRWGT